MEIKAPASQSKARCLHVFLHHRSLPSLPHHLYTSFSGTLACLKWPEIIRHCLLLCSSHHAEDHIGCEWGVWQSRKIMGSCHVAMKHFLHSQMKGCWGGKIYICFLFNVFAYVRCSENCLKPCKQWSACFPKLIPWPVLMQTYIRKLCK